ncbi:MAG: YciI family protein [Chitinophagales bacterium]
MAQRTFEMKEGDTTFVMKEYFLCHLYRGDQAHEFNEEELEAIQSGHLNHINSLANEGKIAIAGPMGDDDELRGIIIFHTESLEEAIALQENDPAIIAGRLRMEIRPWWGAVGSKLP